MSLIDTLMRGHPPEEGQNYNCWLCDHVPPGDECRTCPLLSGAYCELFRTRSNGKKLVDCKKNIKPKVKA